MKKYLVLTVLSLFMTASYAQIDRSTQPKPGPAPKINLKDPARFEKIRQYAMQQAREKFDSVNNAAKIRDQFFHWTYFEDSKAQHFDFCLWTALLNQKVSFRVAQIH